MEPNDLPINPMPGPAPRRRAQPVRNRQQANELQLDPGDEIATISPPTVPRQAIVPSSFQSSFQDNPYYDPREDDPNFDAAAHFRHLLTKGRIHIVNENQTRRRNWTEHWVPYPEPNYDDSDEDEHLVSMEPAERDKILQLDHYNKMQRVQFQSHRCQSMRKVMLNKIHKFSGSAFGLLDLDYLLPSLAQPKFESGKAKLRFAPDLPEDFYVSFNEDWTNVKLIKRYLTEADVKGELEMFEGEPPELGQLVAALDPRTCSYVRGEVAGVLDPKTGTMLIFLIDYSREIKTGLSSLRKLPPQLATFQPYALRCTTASKYPANWDDVRKSFAHHILARFMRSRHSGEFSGRACELDVSIVGRDETNGFPIVEIISGFRKYSKVLKTGKLDLGSRTPSPIDILQLFQGLVNLIDEIDKKPVVKVPREPKQEVFIFYQTRAEKKKAEDEAEAKREKLGILSKLPYMEQRLDYEDLLERTGGTYNPMLVFPNVNLINEEFKPQINNIYRFKVVALEPDGNSFWVEWIPRFKWHDIAPWIPFFKHQKYMDTFALVGHPIIGRYYIWISKISKLPERVLILSYNKKTFSGQLRLLDLGLHEQFHLNFTDTLYEIERRFCMRPVTGFKAYLKHIDVQPEMAEAFGQFMTDIALNQTFDGLILDRKFHFKNQQPEIGLVLTKQSEGITLNALAVMEGFASATGMCAYPFYFMDNPEHTGIDLQFLLTQIQDEFPNIDLEPPKPVPVKVSKKKIKKRWNFYEANEHLRNPKPWMDRQYVTSKKIRCKFPEVRITYLHDASWIMIQPVHLRPIVEHIEHNLELISKHLPPTQVTYEPGEIVMVYCEIPDLKCGITWHRGIVRNIVSSVDLIKGLCIDFGTEFSVKYQYLRQLPETYRNVPGLCYRTHFDVDGLRPLGGLGKLWTSYSGDFLRRYTGSWIERNPIYYAFRPKAHVPGIELTGFRQPVQYNEGADCWEPKTGSYVPEIDVVTKMKDHVLLKHFFTSWGVNICYESWSFAKGYRFGGLWEVLVIKDHALYEPKNQES